MPVFDVIVVGSGSAAGTVASRCRAAGWTVAMIDKQPFGGTCALRGCDPKKVLVGGASAVEAARALSGVGVRADGVGLDWPQLMAFKRTFTDPYAAARKASLARDGIVTFEGVARFSGPSQVAVGDAVLDALRAIVIAAGATPARLAIDGDGLLATSDQFLELASLPPSIVFVGGGYVSFEFAHVAARAGSQVTIVHRGARPLEAFDHDLVDRLVAKSRAVGVDVRLGAEVLSIESLGTKRRVRFRTAAGATTGDTYLDTDLVVHGAGRSPDIAELNLEVGGVRFSSAGIQVSKYLQSVSNPLVWAAGDCAATDGPPLTPVAGYEGRIVAKNMLEGRRTTADYRAIPSVVFTLPPLAGVGLTEHGAQARGLHFSVRHQDTSGWYSSRRVGEAFSAVKVLIERDTDLILGAHLLGPHADETINLFGLAIRTGVTADQFKEMLWAYPTHASDTQYML